ncbi:MAG: tetratricopeptide repeat protein [Desulfosarcina sp.]|nr:tetratricopeptide repeat protein [Desulfosarcina sp.]MBC2741748.1 tetratricopeptide repeat protein [Desulfosarcina sp.]MBC2764662.1 tetratricopeptide repeat protein [Desulfosarcina sp.]
MKQFCQYHPTKPAHWYCDKCNTALCPECVEVRDMGGYHQGEKLHMCPNCNIPVQWLGVENIIDPFWKRMPQFFLYPFSIRPLLLMIVLSLAAALLTRPGIIGILASITVWGLAFKYAYAILQSTASGDLTTPKLDAKTLSENLGPVVKQIGIYVAIFMAAGFVFANLGMAGGVLFLILATLFLPAMIILLVTTESLIQAINPMMFVTLAIRIGWGYLLMYFFYSILGGAPTLLAHHVIQYLPGSLQLFLFTLAKIYYTFISYHLMGYVILQYHQDIGYRVDFEDFKDQETEENSAMAEANDPETRLLKRVNQLIKDGNHEGALGVIESETKEQGISHLLLSERYFTLLKMTNATDRMLDHGRSHLDLLVHADKKKEAVDVYIECMSKGPNFSPTPGALFKLAGWLEETGKNKEAISAFSQLTKAYPQDPLVPKSYFRAAQIFNNRLLNPEKAKKILTGLVKKYPDHDIIPFVERYLGQMG